MPVYKVVMEIESDCDVDQLKGVLAEVLSSPKLETSGCSHLSGVVLAAAETQSSRMRLTSSEQKGEDS